MYHRDLYLKKKTILSWHNHEEATLRLESSSRLSSLNLNQGLQQSQRRKFFDFFVCDFISFLPSTMYALSQIDNISLRNFCISQEFSWIHTWDYEKNESRSSIEIYTHLLVILRHISYLRDWDCCHAFVIQWVDVSVVFYVCFLRRRSDVFKKFAEDDANLT